MIELFWKDSILTPTRSTPCPSWKGLRKDPLWETLPPPCLYSGFAFQKKSCIQPSFQSLNLLSLTEYPDQKNWCKLVEYCLEQMRQQRLEKIVLARKTTLRFKEPVDPYLLLSGLQNKTHNSTLFCFRFDKQRAFLGATPEKLYRRRGRKIECDALAGTRPIGDQFAKELMNSEKDFREFNLVKSFLKNRLDNLCKNGNFAAEDRLLSTSTVQHLSNRFQGILKEGIDDHQLINKLHPTPAVCGWPQQAAKELIEELEPFDRGWYASPFGIHENDSTEALIGIRSALIVDHEVHLYAGVGIVAGSDPNKEWEELQHKTALFRSFLC